MKHLLLFVLVLRFGDTLKCYKCNACESTFAVQESCREVDPDVSNTACLVQKVRVGGTAEPMILKKCVNYGKNEGIYNCQSIPTGDTISCHTCQDDFCNGAPITKITVFLFIPIILIPTLFVM